MPRRPKPAPVPRKQPRQASAGATVDAIVTAVERILERDGPDKLNTNRIAEIAGVSVGTLYQYFPNKEALVGALQERYIQQTLGLCRVALAAAETAPVATVIENMATALLVAQRGQRPIHRWLVELRSAAAFQERRRAALDEFVDELAAFFARRTDLAFAQPRAAAFVIVHGVEGIVSATTTRGDQVELDAIVAETCRMLRGGFAR